MGQSALHIAGLWGSIEAVKALLELKANPNAENNLRGSTPVHAAAMGRGPPMRRAECVKLMIGFKGDPRKPDNGGETPLDCASDEGMRLALGAAPLVLHKAVQTQKAKAVEEAIALVVGGQVDLTLESENPSGDTALHLAAGMGWCQGAELLLAARCNPRAQNHMQRAPVHAAVLQGDHRILQMLLNARASPNAQDIDPDHDARFKSNSFDETPDQHRTALHYAAEFGAVTAVRALLEARADVNVRDSQRVTPLHLCLTLRQDENAEMAAGCGVKVVGLEKRPDLNGRLGAIIGPQGDSDDGKPPRWPVVLEGDQSDGMLLKEENLERLPEETLDTLLEARADVNLGNHLMGETRTVLHEAVRFRDVALARKLLASGVHIDQQYAKGGFSALHFAARAKSHELVRLLVEARADSALVSSNGKTAAELAETNGAGSATVALLRGNSVAIPAEA
eukprot:CAMPEP_0117497066 /NCGR_PEP_ID=MMETSP0784-20121206/20984_1 /TAXON_ID=39447 /ORGANISM="" /LENGTH=451 /DNA_ID=CAMNT_0005292063 /DNA_START=163 /DNA_END=1518 /DNA_ORIENTATION=-